VGEAVDEHHFAEIAPVSQPHVRKQPPEHVALALRCVQLETHGLPIQQFVRVHRCFAAEALDRCRRINNLGCVDANQSNALGSTIVELHVNRVAVDQRQ
jgi:hypothetical protein